MAITNQQGTGKKPATKAERDAAAKAAAENNAKVEQSIDQWRAMQGLPPRDQSKEARND
jgi:hypothetical protein